MIAKYVFTVVVNGGPLVQLVNDGDDNYSRHGRVGKRAGVGNGFQGAFIQKRNAAAFADCDVVCATVRVNGERDHHFPGPSAFSRDAGITQVLPQMSADEVEMCAKIGSSPVATQGSPITRTFIIRTVQ